MTHRLQTFTLTNTRWGVCIQEWLEWFARLDFGWPQAFEAGFWTKLSLDLMHCVTYKSYLLRCSLWLCFSLMLRATFSFPTTTLRHVESESWWISEFKRKRTGKQRYFLIFTKKESLSLSWQKQDNQPWRLWIDSKNRFKSYILTKYRFT